MKVTFWTDRKVRAWSTDARLLAFWLVTNQLRNLLGVLFAPIGTITADHPEWDDGRTLKAVNELLASGFITRDADGWTFITNLLKHDPLQNKNQGTGAFRIWEGVEGGEIKRVAAAKLMAELQKPEMQKLHSFSAEIEALRNCLETLSQPSRTPEPSPVPEPVPSPVPEPAPQLALGAASDAQADNVVVLKPGKSGLPDEVVSLWNAMCVRLWNGTRTVTKLTDKRRRAISARAKDCGDDPLVVFRAAIATVEASDHLSGRSPPGRGYENWTFGFDDFVEERFFIPIMEGKYSNNKPANGAQTSSRIMDAAQEIAAEIEGAAR